MSDRVSVTIEEGVADVRLVRTDKMNALDDAMFTGLVEAGERLRADASVRAVVLSGEGRGFCAGLDMDSFAKIAKGGGLGKLATRTHGINNRGQYAVRVWHDMPVPVIMAVHGVAFGGGFQLCLAGDIRYAAPDTRFSIMEIKWGLIPDMAGMDLLRGLVRDDVLRELAYTGRIFSADEALSYGVATRLCSDPRAEALQLAREIAGKNPTAIRAMKRIFNALPHMDEAAYLLQESVEQDEIVGKPNQVEAVRANLEKRAPTFTD